ncbi:MAG TPA: metallophosphoesterase [Polyangia bacterium]|nr:metallophosphoesterase [Polyangia bacterium]
MRLAIVVAALAAAGVARAEMVASTSITVGPYVQDVRPDGFTVVFDTAGETSAEVRAGAVRVATQGTHHEAIVRGLPASTRAPYRVFVGGADAGGGDVALPDPKAHTLDFVVYGDTRNAGPVGPVLAKLAAAQTPELILYTGDFAPWGSDDAGWATFFADERALLADVPLYPALGNHEIYRDPEASRFRHFFVPPDDGRERLYYHFRFGPAEFVVLDGNTPSPAETAWLRATLDAADRDGVGHIFVLEHQPPLSLGDHCGAAPVQNDWIALFEQHHVRAVFAGHDHAYARMERRGVRYFVSGGGGAPLYAERTCSAYDRAAKRVYVPVHHLLRVHVDGPTVDVSAIGLTDAAPIDHVRFAAGEPAFAMDAPPLGDRERHGAPTWTYAGGAILFVLLGFVLRRRRPR